MWSREGGFPRKSPRESLTFFSRTGIAIHPERLLLESSLFRRVRNGLNDAAQIKAPWPQGAVASRSNGCSVTWVRCFSTP